MKRINLFILGIVLSLTCLWGSVFLTSATTSSCGNGPNSSWPSYCAYTGTAVVQTTIAPFSVSTPANTVVTESILSHARIVRLTDPSTGGSEACGYNNQWNSTPSGGSNDVITNTNGTLVSVSCAGGTTYVLGFNRMTMQTFPAASALVNKCAGTSAFSRVDPLVWYCTTVGKGSTGTVINKGTFSLASTSNLCGLGVGQCPDPSVAATWEPFFDYATCPQAPAGASLSGSIFGIGQHDSAFSENISWTGGQNTARYFFYYVPGSGCSTLDTQGNGVNPIWYEPNGAVNVLSAITATWFIHDSYITGAWASLTPHGCVGASCGTGDAPEAWLANTSQLIMFSAIAHTTGHSTYSADYFFSDDNPQFQKHPLQMPNARLQVGLTSCLPRCQDAHYSGDVNSDSNPLLGTTAGPYDPNEVSPYRNEVIGVSTDGSGTMWRFGKTYASGNNSSGFWATYAIGAPSQDRSVFFFTSDMLCSLGRTSTGLCRWDVFAVELK